METGGAIVKSGMIYDRPYMRPEGRRPANLTAMHWILYVTIGVFIAQLIVQNWFQSGAMHHLFALSSDSLRNGFVWTLITYGFLHGGLLHIGINLLLLYLFGRELVVVLGGKLFCWLYFGSALVGGAVWLAFNLNQPSTLVGASGAVLGLIIFFICMHPNRPMAFFFIPISIRPRTIGYIIIGFNVIGFLFAELPGLGQPGGDNVAYSAHLGGALAGYLFHRLIYSSAPEIGSANPSVEVPQWFKKKQKKRPAGAGVGKYQVNITNRKDLQKEVDRILDKINSEGFGSLSEDEKKTLDQAKDILSR